MNSQGTFKTEKTGKDLKLDSLLGYVISHLLLFTTSQYVKLCYIDDSGR